MRCFPVELARAVVFAITESTPKTKHWIWRTCRDVVQYIHKCNKLARVYFVSCPPVFLPDKATFVRYNLNLKHAANRLRGQFQGQKVYLIPVHTWLVNGGHSWPTLTSLNMWEQAVIVNYIVIKVESQLGLGGQVKWKI